MNQSIEEVLIAAPKLVAVKGVCRNGIWALFYKYLHHCPGKGVCRQCWEYPATAWP